jgi:hypothetical protein
MWICPWPTSEECSTSISAPTIIRRENRQFYAPDTEPTLDLSVPVLAHQRLDNYVLPHPLSHKISKGQGAIRLEATQACAVKRFWTRWQLFRSISAMPTRLEWSLTGTGQNCALFEYDGYFTSDISSYEQQAGLPLVNWSMCRLTAGLRGHPEAVWARYRWILKWSSPWRRAFPRFLFTRAQKDPPTTSSAAWPRIIRPNKSAPRGGYGTDPTTDQIFQEFAAQGTILLPGVGR